MKAIEETYNELKVLRNKLEQKNADRFIIMEEAQKTIAKNGEVEEIFLEEFKFQLENSLDQHPFESPLHIGGDLMSLIYAINKKYQFN